MKKENAEQYIKEKVKELFETMIYWRSIPKIDIDEETKKRLIYIYETLFRGGGPIG